MFAAIKKSIHSLYQQFISMNDSPQRIAIAFGLGFFLGILPFTGLIAAIALAYYFRLNKPAAVLGSVLTNTWLSFVVFGISLPLSSLLSGISHDEIRLKFQNLIKNFHWSDLTDIAMLKIMAAVIFGFFIVSAALSFIAYGVCLAFVYWQRRPR